MAPATPSADDAALGRVHDALLEAAGPGGIVPFDRFLEISLHRPPDGYYARQGALGTSGDFYTAAHVHPMFARALARRVLEVHDRLGRPDEFRLVEVGPGDGTLAHELLRTLRAAWTGRGTLSYVLVEPSPALRVASADRLRGLGDVRVAESLGADGPFDGVVVANELLDALPFRRFIRRGSAWRELGVRWQAARWEWTEFDGASLPAPALPDDADEGTVLEVSPAAEAFVREISDHLERGAAILLDYGADETELVRGRPAGTLAAVREHRSIDDPLDRPGSADLSAFVNFTRVRAAAARSGLRETWYGPQREALARWGLEQEWRAATATAPNPETVVRTQLAMKSLVFGFENFHALELAPPAAG